MQDYLQIANSGWMWFAAIVPMGVLAWQVILLLKKSLKEGKQLGVTHGQIKSAVIGSATASLGPSMSILAGLLTLMVMMGGPIAWMRLSYIGAVMFEMTSADVGAQAVGVAFTKETMTAQAFANGVWAMVLGSIGWIIVSGLFTDKIDKLRTVVSRGNDKMLPIITAGATLGCYCYLTFAKMYPVAISNKSLFAVIGGALSMFLLSLIKKKYHVNWISSWGATISMVVGLAFAAVV
ncbi:MAG: DUF5058 family protein [Oscillospiraceae bacterium]|nr:DUF5058 family protein [Oscillospiraceae bacterium]